MPNTNLHVSDFSQNPDQIVLDLINHDNSSALTLELVELGLPLLSGMPEANTELEVTAVSGSGYKGSVTVAYNRLDIQDFVPIMVGDTLVLPTGDAENYSDLIGEINVALGINLTESDYVDGPIGEWDGIPNETKTIVIPMSADSWVFTNSLTLTLESEDILLSEVIVNTILSGLNLPETPLVNIEDEMTSALQGFDPETEAP